MEHHQDEHIVCADCGASFVFSAAEAAVFAQRGLTAPKRCKECRRARKQQGGHEGGRPPQGGDRWGQPPAPYGGRGPRGGPPQYTGDVNEYRSPMSTGLGGGPPHTPGGPWRGPDAGPPRRPPTRSGPAPYRSGDYRSPMGNGPAPYRSDDYRSPMPDRGYPSPQGGQAGGNRGRSGQGAAPAHNGGPSPRPPRGPFRDEGERRPQAHAGPPPRRQAAPTFQITCDACGNQAEVPFKPAEGREVYCQPCYRARKPQQ